MFDCEAVLDCVFAIPGTRPRSKLDSRGPAAKRVFPFDGAIVTLRIWAGFWRAPASKTRHTFYDLQPFLGCFGH
jgi:hypothetical protein